MRFAVFMIALVLALPAWAEDTKVEDSASATVPVTKEAPEVLRARRLDLLLGKVHKAPAGRDVSSLEAEIFEIWARHSSPTAEVFLRESSIAINAGDFEPAEKILSQLIETYPDFAEGWSRRATLYYLQERFDVALIDVDHALKIEPRNYSALAGRGMILRAMKRDDEAVAAFNEALAINPNMESVKLEIKLIDKNAPHV